MRAVGLLTARGLTIFGRDRAGVFFALLSALVLVGLYGLFLGHQQVEDIADELPGATTEEITPFVTAWVIAGLVVILSVTTPLAALAVVVEDRSTGRFADLLVTPLRRSQLVLGYLATSLLVTLTMTVAVLVAGQALLLVQGADLLPLPAIASLLGATLLAAATFAAMGSLAVTLVSGTSAFTAFSTVVGTLTGFLAGAYVPLGALPAWLPQVLHVLPFSQAAMLIRRPLTDGLLDSLSDGDPAARDAVAEFYGVTGSVGDVEVTSPLAVAVLLGVLVLFGALGTRRLTRLLR